MTRPATAFAAVLATAFLLPASALAKMDPEVAGNKDIGYCCSEADCRKALPGELQWTPAGWQVTGLEGTLPEGSKGLKHMRSNKAPWYCEYPTGHVRCIFLPRTGG